MNIPSGIVTFLFTDIEGSTMLAQDFPDTLPVALQKHHSILSLSIESNNGFLFKTTGDAFCCSFEKAVDALNAALEIQRKLTAEKWTGAVIKVRMGIHSGVAEWSGTDYTGYITLAATERIMSAASGEQILVSNDAYELSVPKLGFGNESIGSEISFRDLGERRLKNVIQPIRLFQIVSLSLRDDFPPLKTLDARPNNLPVQLTSFIGREEEIKQVKKLLKDTHLLTITGSGGAGKTRLALQVAADVIDDFANGVWFVELASLLEPDLLPQAIMKLFELKEEPKRSLEDTLCDYLKDKEILIILDNCEHLIEPCAKLAEKLLSNSLKLKIMATSREALRCEGEQTHRVLSLEMPDPKEEMSPGKLSQYEAVRLFIERALAVDENFRINNENAPALAQICYQLDGIPLAIELAAARIKILSVEKIYEKLNDRFHLLTGGKRTVLPRQQTLRALIDWSYDLLSEVEKLLWRRLSVFVGGWTLEAAEEVCFDEKIKKQEVLELLNQLAGKSIIIFEREKERYMILETLKQYGVEKLKEANEEEYVFSRHFHYYMELSEKAEPTLKRGELEIWMERRESEHGNFQSAIVCSLKYGNREEGARLAGALGGFWNIRGYYSTGKRLLDSILDNAQGVSKFALGKVLNWNGTLIMHMGQYEEARKYLERSLLLKSEIGDKRGIATSFNSLGNLVLYLGNYDEAQKFYEKSLTLSREIGDERAIANTLSNLGILEFSQENYEQAQEFSGKSLAMFRELGSKLGTANSLCHLGRVAFHQGNYEQAQKFYEESLTLRRVMGDKYGIGESLSQLGSVSFRQGNYEQAQKLIEESLALQREIGSKLGIADSLINLGNVLLHEGKYEQAQKFFEESLTLNQEMRDKLGILLHH